MHWTSSRSLETAYLSFVPLRTTHLKTKTSRPSPVVDPTTAFTLPSPISKEESSTLISSKNKILIYKYRGIHMQQNITLYCSAILQNSQLPWLHKHSENMYSIFSPVLILLLKWVQPQAPSYKIDYVKSIMKLIHCRI